MKVTLKHIAATASLCIMLAGFAVLHSCVGKENSRKLCESLEVRIEGDLEFVSEQDIKGYMDKHYGCYIGAPLDSLNLGYIESLLKQKQVVKGCEAWVTNDGVLHVSIQQREPALRFDRNGTGFYIDREGSVIPLHPSYTAPVPVITGNIPPLEKGDCTEWELGVIGLTDFISSSKQWKDRVEEISVNGSGDLVLKLQEGKERFIFGEPDGLKEKFGKMEKYFSHIAPSKEEGYYKRVNLKYNKQIICRKDI